MKSCRRHSAITAAVNAALACPILWGYAAASAPDRCAFPTALSDVNRARAVEGLSRDPHERTRVELLAASGCYALTQRRLLQLGGAVLYSDPNVGFIDVSVPSGGLLDALELGGLDAAGVSEAAPPAGELPAATIPTPLPLPAIKLPTPQVATELAPAGPYFPITEARLDVIRQAHPQGDGRGTRIAFVDQGFDLLHPALEKALDSQGREIPKVADLVASFTTEVTASSIKFEPPVVSVDRQVRFAGRIWKVPTDGPYRLGMFRHKLALGGFPPAPDATEINVSVGALWDPQKNEVRVDTDGDGDFTNNRPLHDYGERQEMDWFGTRVGDEDNRVPFGIKIDRERGVVYVDLSRGEFAIFIPTRDGTARRGRGQPFGRIFPTGCPLRRSSQTDHGANRPGVRQTVGLPLCRCRRDSRYGLSERGDAASQSTESRAACQCNEQRGLVYCGRIGQ